MSTVNLYEYLRVGDSTDEYVENVLNKRIYSKNFKEICDIITIIQSKFYFDDQIVLWPRYYWKPEPKFGYLQVWEVDENSDLKNILGCVRLLPNGKMELMYKL